MYTYKDLVSTVYRWQHFPHVRGQHQPLKHLIRAIMLRAQEPTAGPWEYWQLPNVPAATMKPQVPTLCLPGWPMTMLDEMQQPRILGCQT